VSRRWKSRGFTLIELLFAVSLLGVLITGASHSFGETMTRKQLVSAAQAIEQEIQLARRETEKRNADLVVSFTAGASWCLGVDTASCDCTTSSDCSVRELTAADFSERVSLNTVSFAGATAFTLQRIRGVASASGVVDLQTTSGLDLRVRLLATGRTHLCSPSDTVIGYPSC
jgi:type IV fimbrial biogenesis protein FimT